MQLQQHDLSKVISPIEIVSFGQESQDNSHLLSMYWIGARKRASEATEANSVHPSRVGTSPLYGAIGAFFVSVC